VSPDFTDILIKYWLHQPPVEDVDEYAKQAADAQWMENRYFETMSKITLGTGKM
jgi:hypothetical protein